MVPGGCGGKRGGDCGSPYAKASSYARAPADRPADKLVWLLWGSRQEKFPVHAVFHWSREIQTRISWFGIMNFQPALPSSFLAAVFLDHQVSFLSAVIGDQNAAISERDFFGLPGGTYSFAKASSYAKASADRPADRLVEALGL